jgi:hypothetical protein
VRPHALNVLLACLQRLRTANLAWCRVAARHHEYLMLSKLPEAEECLPELERILQGIAEEENLRIEKTVELAEILGLESDPPPRLEKLAAALPEECGRDLSQAGMDLREALVGARTLADRIRGVAEVGLKISETVLSMASRAATAKVRPAAAYARGGHRTVGTAVPVFHRAWKA